MEKRKAQIRSPFTRRASSNDSYDGNPSSSQGIQLIHRTSSYDFINGTITDLNQSSSSSTEDYPPSLEARTLNQLPYLSSNKRYRKSVSTAARRFCPRPIFSLIILLFIIGSLFFFFGVDLDTIERAIGLKDGKSLRSSTLKHHGSVLQEFGKSDEVKVKLKNKDKITKRDMVIIGENQVKKIVEIIDGKRYESEELSDFHTKPKWKNLSDFGQVPNLRGANDDLLVQLVKDRKQKLSEKLQDNQDVLNHPPPSSLPPSAHDVMDLDQMRQQIDTLIRKIRFMKEHDRTVMETNATARHAIQELQGKLRPYLLQKYGSPPYRVEMQLHFPASMETKGKMEDTIVIQLAPIDLVPYSVFYFLQVLENWKGGAFHRRAGHVLQAMVSSRIPSLAFQEYHKAYPHVKFTLGYAGRPGGPEFYISTLDNTYNHGPGSQGSKTEADSCFGKIVEGLEVVKRMQSQPGAGPSGFINDPQNFIRITSLKLLPPT